MLSERRKADRAKMADHLETLIREMGAKVERDENPPLSPRAVWLNVICAHGLRLTIDLDGESSQPDVHVLSWHGVDDGWKLSSAPGWSVNNCHFHKATDVAHGFDALCSTVAARLRAVADGTAFQPQA